MNQTTKIILGAIVLGAVGFVVYRTLNPRKSDKPQHTGISDVELRKIENICETRFNTDAEVKKCVYDTLNSQSTPVGRKPMTA